MRVVYTGGPLPADRESLFTLSIAAIPSGKPEANRVQMAFRSALKLLYRPEGLAGNPQQAYRHLIWSLTPDGATVRNPTPYYVTLFYYALTSAPRQRRGCGSLCNASNGLVPAHGSLHCALAKY